MFLAKYLMGCIQQTMSCSELTIVRLELSSNLLPCACALQLLFFFCKPRNYFLAAAKEVMELAATAQQSTMK